MSVRAEVEEHIRRHDLIAPGGEVLALVSGGADSTCLWHALRELGYRVSALHVNHGLRGAESDEDARFCRETLGAEVVDAPAPARPTEGALRDLRYSLATDRLRATGHTASDQVETVLYRLVSSGTAKAIKPKREDGVVRPLLTLWREETEAYCRAEGLAFRSDSSNPGTRRGLIREEILPPPASSASGGPSATCSDSPSSSRRSSTSCWRRRIEAARSRRRPHGRAGVRPRVARADPVALDGSVRWGQWSIESELAGLKVRTWRAGDRLAGRNKKIQDVFVDAKIPRSEREAWPLVVRGREVVAVPGIVEAPGVTAERVE